MTATPTAQTLGTMAEIVLTLDDVAERLKLSRRTVERLVRTGEIPSRKIGGSVRVIESQLDAYLRGEINGKGEGEG